MICGCGSLPVCLSRSASFGFVKHHVWIRAGAGLSGMDLRASLVSVAVSCDVSA
jgi:hypothetical protein